MKKLLDQEGWTNAKKNNNWSDRKKTMSKELDKYVKEFI
jgi:hypothetical protein